MAKLAWRYKQLEDKRELTATEKDVFALESLRVSFGKVEAAVRAKAKGPDDLYKTFLEQASVHNPTTPEQIGRFLMIL